jgi:LDH2 family malate/lactate/ureidoglycolate dehydrogenase
MEPEASETKYIRVTAAKAQSCVQGILVGNGVSEENAIIIAKCLVQADLRGVDTHGMNRIPSYMARVRQGVLDSKATPTLKKITPVVAQV